MTALEILLIVLKIALFAAPIVIIFLLIFERTKAGQAFLERWYKWKNWRFLRRRYIKEFKKNLDDHRGARAIKYKIVEENGKTEWYNPLLQRYRTDPYRQLFEEKAIELTNEQSKSFSDLHLMYSQICDRCTRGYKGEGCATCSIMESYKQEEKRLKEKYGIDGQGGDTES